MQVVLSLCRLIFNKISYVISVQKRLWPLLLQGACVDKLSGKGKVEDSKARKQVVALLSAPLEKYKDIDTALKLSNYPRVMEYLDDGTKREMANVIIQNIMKNKSCISTSDKVCWMLFYVIVSNIFLTSNHVVSTGWGTVWATKGAY